MSLYNISQYSLENANAMFYLGFKLSYDVKVKDQTRMIVIYSGLNLEQYTTTAKNISRN